MGGGGVVGGMRIGSRDRTGMLPNIELKDRNGERLGGGLCGLVADGGAKVHVGVIELLKPYRSFWSCKIESMC